LRLWVRKAFRLRELCSSEGCGPQINTITLTLLVMVQLLCVKK